MSQFTATVYSRTGGKPQSGAASESQLHALNPQRAEALVAYAGWSRLREGTLNLRASAEALDAVIEKPRECLYEPGTTVNYPDGKTTIQERRVGYRYYRASLADPEGRRRSVLIRRAVVPHSRDAVEAFAEVHLREELSLSDGTQVTIRLL